MGDENCQNLALGGGELVSYPSRRIGVDQVVEVHQVQQQQRPMLELVQIWRLPSSLTPSLASCTTFLPCLACTALAGLPVHRNLLLRPAESPDFNFAKSTFSFIAGM